MGDKQNIWDQRTANLKLMGFATYDAYLKSELWEWIATRLSRLDLAKKCYICESEFGLQWHHRSYDIAVLAGNFSMPTEGRGPIVRLCTDCHTRAHFDNGVWIQDFDQVDERADFDDFETGRF